MITWRIDYSNSSLPARLRKGDVVYTLERTSGYFPYILNYKGFESPFDDCKTIGIQAYGDTEKEAVNNMKKKLKELGIEF